MLREREQLRARLAELDVARAAVLAQLAAAPADDDRVEQLAAGGVAGAARAFRAAAARPEHRHFWCPPWLEMAALCLAVDREDQAAATAVRVGVA